MNYIKYSIATILLVTSSFGSAEELSDNTAIQLIEIEGGAQKSIDAIKALLPQLKAMYPNQSEEFWHTIESKMDADSLNRQLLPIYQDNFTEEEAIEILRFYRTEAGKKFLTQYSSIQKKVFSVSRAWARSLDKEFKHIKK
ncbi:DUF2059 domain-containing protein [Endozoicomonas sp. G2_1]|uniref:DUF2059 domain-containing protein n=1 Tax=Endozoicomonas sp. G2_1 TaxID=2821091 RepID=UPI001ADA2EB9|nr:DUF2059 domain-containing protein [Endozoicomonas sp. G2_1]MBO9491999.1 DUF2059 domain-containing protein [Endozoicomonas sp. G2_1]